MNAVIAPFHQALKDLCQRFRVERLYLFGSAAAGAFRSDRSDFDFLVAMENQPPGEYADNYLGLAQALEQLLQRPVDLVTEQSLRNPYLRQRILGERQLLYDRHDEKAAA